jgi:GTP-binding protein Era
VFKSGFIGIIGRPNVGKSTLLNSIVGERIAIATHKPQTTRNRIMGIRNLPEGQLIFLDTPGIHRAETLLNKYMVDTALDTFGNSDLLLLVVEADAGYQKGDQYIIDALGETAGKVKIPIILVINKIDLIAKPQLLPLIERFQGLFPFTAIVPISARTGDGISILLEEIWPHLNEGPEYFPEDMMTDRSERFIAAEMIREQIILLVRQEVPYSLAVVVEAFQEVEKSNLLRIQAVINVEKDSHKGILIGRQGAMLKQIGTAARLSLEKFFATRVYLELFVKVRPGWTKDAKILKEFGYGEKS